MPDFVCFINHHCAHQYDQQTYICTDIHPHAQTHTHTYTCAENYFVDLTINQQMKDFSYIPYIYFLSLENLKI